ncbi:LysR family transcriptional regulator [Roseicitreum antarcticum]|uniref:LysR substrate binding domain-containing protein n=1 Tax=Roseicitreum antarcticum TaxID=564137 RepID=A0A1H3FPP0_9RHOB|nr:LysR family transcriptional regulator [Roseicitreum antarcticum]SDX92880.1 LysR substrate binding domain-containing protein [Roseicitreum antarcticum]
METNTLRAYALVVEEGSFSAAARRLGISKSMCSKHISDLEDILGARLLTRSTRSVKATALGGEYYTKVRRILDLLDEANDYAKTESGTITGRLRIGMPMSYSLHALQPHILKFMEIYPEIQLECVFDDRRRECPIFCVTGIWSMLPERSKDDDDFQGTAGRTSEGLRAA